jgi:hypothetical protein
MNELREALAALRKAVELRLTEVRGVQGRSPAESDIGFGPASSAQEETSAKVIRNAPKRAWWRFFW